ncbi:MAG: hypothetical protein JOZ02_05485 [Acidobacteria bacterium]|nr:hypothetical protein [Acidobacteriota bacterium]
MSFLDNLLNSDSEQAQADHEQGQADGSQADLIDSAVYHIFGGGSDAYNAGYENGLNNQPDDD